MTRGKTLYLRTLPENLVREAKAVAARRGVTLTALVAEALRRIVEPFPGGGTWPAEEASSEHKGESVQELVESMQWFEANRLRLLRRYRNEYVAIYRKQVIDHDPDFDALARRVFAKLGPVPVCMPKVTAQERVVRVPSPRLVESEA